MNYQVWNLDGADVVRVGVAYPDKGGAWKAVQGIGRGACITLAESGGVLNHHQNTPKIDRAKLERALANGMRPDGAHVGASNIPAPGPVPVGAVDKRETEEPDNEAEDADDVAVARERIAELRDGSARIVRGEELRQKLVALIRTEDEEKPDPRTVETIPAPAIEPDEAPASVAMCPVRGGTCGQPSRTLDHRGSRETHPGWEVFCVSHRNVAGVRLASGIRKGKPETPRMVFEAMVSPDYGVRGGSGRAASHALPAEKVARIKELSSNGAGVREIAREVKIHPETVVAHAGAGDQHAGLVRHHERRKAEGRPVLPPWASKAPAVAPGPPVVASEPLQLPAPVVPALPVAIIARWAVLSHLASPAPWKVEGDGPWEIHDAKGVPVATFWHADDGVGHNTTVTVAASEAGARLVAMLRNAGPVGWTPELVAVPTGAPDGPWVDGVSEFGWVHGASRDGLLTDDGNDCLATVWSEDEADDGPATDTARANSHLIAFVRNVAHYYGGT